MPERIPGRELTVRDGSRAFVGGAEVFGGQDELLDPRALKGERVQESQDCRPQEIGVDGGLWEDAGAFDGGAVRPT
ncbi:hypothetical protein GCM10010299_44580 [Streptomyces tanashiensis]|nr:hypothetical protein GCM10010299_44580 [Streptomyces tanashiensis]